jgi:WD40 repeat protein/uncharacterized caspase-like protein
MAYRLVVRNARDNRHGRCRPRATLARLLSLIAILIVAAPASAQTSDEPCYLMLDSGGHMGSIYGAFLTADGRHLISAGDDKVIRIWDVQERKTVRTLRGEAGRGHHGKILAMVVSHDGRWIAAGGIMAPGNGVRDDDVGDIRIYAFDSGDLVRRLHGHRKAVWSLAFSPDDRFLISGSEDSTAIIWDLASRRALQRLDHKRGANEYEVRAVGFSSDGARAVTGDYNKKIRLWRVSDGRQLSEQTGRDKVRALAVSPTTGVIATGDKDGGEIRLWNGTTGAPVLVRGRQVFANQRSGIGALSFSPDGRRLLSTCGDSCESFEQTIWDVASGTQVTSYVGHKGVAENTVFAASFSADGKLAVTADSSSSEVHIWDAQNAGSGQPVVLRGNGAPVWAVGFSRETDRLAWGHRSVAKSYNDRGPLESQLRFPTTGRSLEQPARLTPDDAGRMVRALEAVGPYSLAMRNAPGQGDALLELRQGDQIKPKPLVRNSAIDGTEHDSFTFSPDGQSVFSGGDNGKVIAYDLEGRRQLPDFDGHEGEVWAIAPSSDGRFVISGGVDKTVRLWNAKTRELIVTFFDSGDGDWVLWTPQGYYASSPGGDRFVGWQVNRGPDQVPEFFSAYQLKSKFYRPDLVEQAITLASAEGAIREARLRSPDLFGFDVKTLASRTPPKFSLASPRSGQSVSTNAVILEVEFTDAAATIPRLEVFVNGAQAWNSDTAPAARPGLQRIPIAVTRGPNQIRVRATNDIGSTEQRMTLFGMAAKNQPRNLYIIAVGVDQYANMPAHWCKGGKCNLDYAGADAQAFAAQIRSLVKAQFSKIECYMLIDEAPVSKPADANPGSDCKLLGAPTVANITDILDQVRRVTTQDDTVALFFAGHGVNDKVGEEKQYLFLPSDAKAAADQKRFHPQTVLTWDKLQDYVTTAKGRRLMFVDTCHAAGAYGSYNQRVTKEGYDNEIVVFSAVGGEQPSEERAELGHGVFTYSVLRGLEGEAAVDKKIMVLDLATFISHKVRTLTNDKQRPYFYFKSEDFLIANMP